jgi:hypothetical protein
MAVIHSKRPNNVITIPIPRSSKICPNWDFWFENIPSGNPGLDSIQNDAVNVERWIND